MENRPTPRPGQVFQLKPGREPAETKKNTKEPRDWKKIATRGTIGGLALALFGTLTAGRNAFISQGQDSQKPTIQALEGRIRDLSGQLKAKDQLNNRFQEITDKLHQKGLTRNLYPYSDNGAPPVLLHELRDGRIQTRFGEFDRCATDVTVSDDGGSLVWSIGDPRDQTDRYITSADTAPQIAHDIATAMNCN